MQATKNARMLELIKELRRVSDEEEAAIWDRIADDLDKPSRERREVNIYHLERNCSDGDTVVVPGKVLGTGELTTELTVAAFDYSSSAERKIEEHGEALTLHELMEDNPDGDEVRIIG